jgi:hypothetical protein
MNTILLQNIETTHYSILSSTYTDHQIVMKNTIFIAIMAVGSIALASPAVEKLVDRGVPLGCATSKKSPTSEAAAAAAQYLVDKGQLLCQNTGPGCIEMVKLSM